mmetsp:Transcript_10647/g.25626  ORF Transcript_10647/g.25626 Transcript_10647/m.25626 type:complete len:313 (+) Transcript_10647:95-1033(+)
MAESQKIAVELGGSKRRPQQDLHSFDEPATKTKRSKGGNGKYDFDIAQAEHQNGNEYCGDKSNDFWDEQLHSHFVSAIFEVGLKHSSPAIILENMTQKMETITSERVKSKLQKYRSNKNKDKSKLKFMTTYREFLDRIKAIQADGKPQAGIIQHQQGIIDGSSSDPILSKLMEEIANRTLSDKKDLLGGDVAGYLTYSVMKENSQMKNVRGVSPFNGTATNAVLPTNLLRKGSREYVERFSGSSIEFPVLTEIEKKSSLGIAMTFITGLFLTMSQHLTRERARAETIELKSLPAKHIDDNDARENNTTIKHA